MTTHSGHAIDDRFGSSLMRWLDALAALAVTVVAGAVVVLATGLIEADQPMVERSLTFRWPAVVGLLLLAAGCLRTLPERRGIIFGSSVVLLAWALPGLAAWPVLSARPRAELLAVCPLVVAGVALVLAQWTRPTRAAWPWLPLAVGLSAAAASVHALGMDPFLDPGCRQTCEPAPAVLSAWLDGWQVAVLGAGLTFAGSLALVVGVASRRGRGIPTSLRMGAITAAVFGSAGAALPVWRWADTGRGLPEEWLRGLSVVSLGVPLITEGQRIWRIRRAVRGVVAELASQGAPSGRRGSVVAIHFAVPGDGRWVDETGQLVQSTEPDQCAFLSDEHGPAVRLVLGRNTRPEHVLGSVTPAGRLALANSRLRAVGLVNMADVRASQERIVQTTDRERRRIERDLHDGAQQRLVAVILGLSWAARRDTTGSGALVEGEAQVRAALAALRELSHDSLAAVLGAEGLEAALEELSAHWHQALHVDLCIEPGLADRLSPELQMAAWCTVVAGLDNVVRHAAIDKASVTVTTEHRVLIVSVSDVGIGGAVVGPGLRDVADRIGALGGQFQLTSAPGLGTTVTVRCGS